MKVKSLKIEEFRHFENIEIKFSNGVKIDAPKDMLGRKVYVVVRK